MTTAILIILSLSLGIALGWYAERLLRYVVQLNREPVATGVVKPGISPQSNSVGGVVKARSPKQVAADQERDFNDEFEL